MPAKYVDRIAQELKHQGISQSELGQMVVVEGKPVGKQVINYLLKERFKNTPLELVYTVYRVLGLTRQDAALDMGLIDETKEGRRSAWAQRLIERAEHLSPENQEALEAFLDALEGRRKKKLGRLTRKGIAT